MAYTVVRIDKLSGQDVNADMNSLRMYEGENMIEIENGVIAELVALEDGQREIYKAKVATSSSKLADCVLVATPEVLYDQRKRNLDDFINEKGAAVRGFTLRTGNIFSLTKEGFVNGTVPAVGDKLVIGAGGKLTKGTSGTIFGTCIDINVVGRYTYYAVKIGKINA